jgi:hypothetical protein
MTPSSIESPGRLLFVDNHYECRTTWTFEYTNLSASNVCFLIHDFRDEFIRPLVRLTLPLCWFEVNSVVKYTFPMKNQIPEDFGPVMMSVEVHLCENHYPAFLAPIGHLSVIPAWNTDPEEPHSADSPVNSIPYPLPSQYSGPPMSASQYVSIPSPYSNSARPYLPTSPQAYVSFPSGTCPAPPSSPDPTLAQRYVSMSFASQSQQFATPPMLPSQGGYAAAGQPNTGVASLGPGQPPPEMLASPPPVQFIALRPQCVFDARSGQWMWSYIVPNGCRVASQAQAPAHVASAPLPN